jgi:hypothetical protein
LRSLLRGALEILDFMAPAYVANMLPPPLVKHWRAWNLGALILVNHAAYRLGIRDVKW